MKNKKKNSQRGKGEREKKNNKTAAKSCKFMANEKVCLFFVCVKKIIMGSDVHSQVKERRRWKKKMSNGAENYVTQPAAMWSI